MNWPHEPLGNSAIIQFCKRLLAAARASELKPGGNYSVRRTAQGTFLEVRVSGLGSLVEVTLCDEDGNPQIYELYGFKKPPPGSVSMDSDITLDNTNITMDQ